MARAPTILIVNIVVPYTLHLVKKREYGNKTIQLM